jgi:hypothetical protein
VARCLEEARCRATAAVLATPVWSGVGVRGSPGSYKQQRLFMCEGRWFRGVSHVEQIVLGGIHAACGREFGDFEYGRGSRGPTGAGGKGGCAAHALVPPGAHPGESLETTVQSS